MSEDLTPRQQILLWDLVSRGGSALQGELKPPVTPKDREPLVRARMISVAKTPSRAIKLTVTESGWNHIASRAPTLLKADGSKYDRPILQFVLARLQAFVTEMGVSYADVFAPKNLKKESHLLDQIKDAFLKLAGRPPTNYVRLHAFRGLLDHIPRSRLDAELIQMEKSGTLSLSTLSNPPDIEREKDAPLRVGEKVFHTIWVHQ